MTQVDGHRPWTTRRLEDCGQFLSGGTPDRARVEYWNGSIPWISAKSLKSFYLTDAEERVTEAGVEHGTRVVRAGTLLFVVRGMSLAKEFRVGVATRPLAFNQDVRALIPSPDIDAGYLVHFLRSAEARILGLVDRASHGTTRLTSDRLEGLDVPIPSIVEQRRIAGVLDRAEELRAIRRAALAQLDTLTQSIFIDLFGDSDARGWPVATVSDLASQAPGSIRTGPFGSQLLHSEFVQDGVAVLGIDNVVANEFRWGERRFVSEAKYRQLRRYTVHPGDVLVTIMGTCGRCAVVPDDIPVAINTKHLCCITLDTKRCLPPFLHAFFLLHPVARRYLARAAKGAIMAGLNTGILRAMPVPVPPIELQHEFAHRASAIDRLKADYRASLAEMDALFASLEHRAFRGEL